MGADNRKDAIQVEKIINHFTMPEYPETSEKGIGHVIHLDNSSNNFTQFTKSLHTNVSTNSQANALTFRY